MTITRAKTLSISVSLLATLALVLTGCGSTTPEASNETPAVSKTATSAAPATPTVQASRAVAFEIEKTNDGKSLTQTAEDDHLRQLSSAREYIAALTSSRYVMSGEWVEDGMKTTDLAILYKNFLTPAFIDKLNAANKVEEVRPEPVLMVLGLGTVTQAGGVKASAECKKNKVPSCAVMVPWDATTTNAFKIAGSGIDQASVQYLPGGHLKFTSNNFIPVATFEGVDSAMEAVLEVDLVMVANPDANNPEKLPYLVDQVNIKQTSAGITPMSETLRVN